MKTYKHKTNGTIATYKDGVFKQDNICVEIGCEPSSDFWEELIWVTEDDVQLFGGENIYVPQRDGKKLNGKIAMFNIGDLRHNDKSVIFAKKENAEEYILENIPCLSLSDLYDFNTQFADKIDILVDARNLVKKRLKYGKAN